MKPTGCVQLDYKLASRPAKSTICIKSLAFLTSYDILQPIGGSDGEAILSKEDDDMKCLTHKRMCVTRIYCALQETQRPLFWQRNSGKSEVKIIDKNIVTPYIVKNVLLQYLII